MDRPRGYGRMTTQDNGPEEQALRTYLGNRSGRQVQRTGLRTRQEDRSRGLSQRTDLEDRFGGQF
jgi:hypothetical protein